jgi:hypothetical protein
MRHLAKDQNLECRSLPAALLAQASSDPEADGAVNLVKSGVRSVLTSPWMSNSFTPWRRGRAVVFMLHRCRDRGRDIEGYDPNSLRRGLAYLRREHYELVSLGELFRRLAGGGEGLTRAIAFTMGDRYLDQAEIEGPVFAEFDCLVPTFVSTGFLDRHICLYRSLARTYHLSRDSDAGCVFR